MTFWNIFGKFAYSDKGETIQKLSGSTSISSNGTIYNTMGSTTTGSDGSMFTQMAQMAQMGSFSSDGSVRMGSTADGLGAVFNRGNDLSGQHSSMRHRIGGRCDDDGF